MDDTTLAAAIVAMAYVLVKVIEKLLAHLGKEKITKDNKVPTRENGTPLTWADPASERAIKELPDLMRTSNETGRQMLKETQEMSIYMKRLMDFDEKILAASEKGIADHRKIRESVDETLYLIQQTNK